MATEIAGLTRPKLNKEGNLLTDNTLRRGVSGEDGFTFVSPDFTDRTTWYQKAVKATTQTLTDSGNGLTFQAAEGKRHWINIHSDKITLDYKKVLLRDGSLITDGEYEVIVYVDGVEREESSEGHSDINPPENPNYTINYTAGSVTFVSSQTGKTVTATFYHNDGVDTCSEFLFVPPLLTVAEQQVNGMFLLEHVELQFSSNLTFTNRIVMEAWAGDPTYSYGFTEQEFVAGYGQERSIYRSHRDLINWCNNQYPPIPASGEFTNSVLCFPFRYLIPAEIRRSLGTCIRFYLSKDIPLTGEIATVTIYTVRNPE